jgi:hypothetical protein
MTTHTDQYGDSALAAPTANGGSGALRGVGGSAFHRLGAGPSAPLRTCWCCSETSPLMLVEGSWTFLGHFPALGQRARRG